ncbi:hypothetical protein BR93DRAFT_324876 [Coniochaeta sp. PMI_546]|nr:hypothetical protein BR93DRAFT_324876 [Coniochaeta sp. PMI_546]
MALHNKLWAIFTDIFEPVLALWTGPDCSPYPVPAHMSGLTVLQLVVSLDWANCVCGTIYTATNDAVPTSHACPRCDRSVKLALIASVHAFSLRWLPLVTDEGVDCQELMSLGDRLWQNARTRVMSIFDKLSYQSVLALYLFGLTPTYQGVLVDENTVRVAGEVSVDMALRQIHRLRVKRQDLSFSGTGLSPSAEQAQRQADGDRQSFIEDFIHAENMMYWAAVVFDISASMTRGSPSILISGVFGFEDEPVIRLMKARVQLFHESTEAWRQNGFVPTSQTALFIVHRASTWKGYLWKVIGALREAINNGHEQSVIARLQALVREGLERFDGTFRPLLAVCERHILFLSKDARLCYYLLQLHYHMGLLLLCSLVSSIKRLDIVPDFESVRREAVHTIFSTVSFGLGCNVAFDKSGTHVSLISIDPYPHHVLASLQLASDVLLVYLERGEISHDAFESSCRIALDALDALPQSLSSVQRAKKSLHHKLRQSMHPPGTDSSVPLGMASATLATPREKGLRHSVNDIYHIGLVDGGATSKGSGCDIVGTNEASSL